MTRTLDAWIDREAISFTLAATQEFEAAVSRMVKAVGASVQLLGFGEALHGSEEILQIRNRLFQTLVKSHGYSAIAIETSFPHARAANEYVLGKQTADDEGIKSWLSHGFGLLDANRELLEWMREYNADPAHDTKVEFYGFDIPLGKFAFASPRVVLMPPLDFLASVDATSAAARRARIIPLIGEDAAWENMEAIMDPSKSIGATPRAISLRIETEELISELRFRAPELIAQRGYREFQAALHDAVVARQLLNAHAAQARQGGHSELLGIRDALMADNLEYIVRREESRGKVLAYAHNGHLKRGQMQWAMGPVIHSWWPAGAQLSERMSGRYAVIGTAVGTSADNGIAAPEEGSLEARLIAASGELRFVPTRRGEGIDSDEIARCPTRSSSKKNATYFPLTPSSFSEYDGLVALADTSYNRGGPPLQTWSDSAEK